MKHKIFILVDALQFYVSCERAFQIALRNQPIIVAGNNDGRIVALSPEAKKLGLQRGQALFQCEKTIRQHQVQVFSSNYALAHAARATVAAFYRALERNSYHLKTRKRQGAKPRHDLL